MTEFEFERLQAVFEYLEDRLLDKYDEELKSEDEQLVKKLKTRSVEIWTATTK